MRLAVAIAVLGGCNFDPTLHTGDGGTGGDGKGSDMMVIDVDPALCFGAGDFTVCLPMLPPAPLTLFDQTIETDIGPCATVVDPGGGHPGLCVLSGTTVNINGTVRGQGGLPLVIVATTGDLTVSGTLDVSTSRSNTRRGAGGSFGGCAVSTNGMGDNNGGGGGAGGSFGTPGGNGANGGGGGAAGMAPAGAGPAFVRGGCRGGNGGGAGSTGQGGDGGGAVYLISQGTLRINGILDASGSGGEGTNVSKAGGGGAGSGGLIALYGKTAIAVNPAAVVFANGGGGGAGADSNTSGNSGGKSSGPGVGGGGGSGPGPGGGGGIQQLQGGMGSNLGGKGGGGGGGGVGFVKIVSGPVPVTGTFSPPPMN